MSNSTSKLRGILAFSMLVPLLAACLQGSNAVQKAEMGRGTITVTAPQGYCVDSRGSDDSFLLLASCASITRNPSQARPFSPAILTVSVTPRGVNESPIAKQYTRLDRFFRSDAGRRALSRDDMGDGVKLVKTRMQQGAFTLHARDTRPGGSVDQWRSVFDAGAFIVSASVTTIEGQPISSDAGAATLTALTALIKPTGRN